MVDVKALQMKEAAKESVSKLGNQTTVKTIA
jgi:hypothetical protein